VVQTGRQAGSTEGMPTQFGISQRTIINDNTKEIPEYFLPLGRKWEAETPHN